MNDNKIGSHTTVVIQVLLYWYLITSIDVVLKLFDIQEKHKVYVIYGGVIQRYVE
jgi:hypothetical protein